MFRYTNLHEAPRAGLSQRRGTRRKGRAALSILLAVCGQLPVQAQSVSEEFRLKAAFLYRFPQFVEWPAHTLDGRKTVDLCVLDPNPFRSFLSELVAGEAIEGRTLLVRQVDTVAQLDGCHVLFLPTAATAKTDVLRRVANLPIPTVGDTPDFLDEGGIIQLRLVAHRVRFDISVPAAERAGLRLSAQLLRLAVTVRGGPS